jgi:hypothetical protein
MIPRQYVKTAYSSGNGSKDGGAETENTIPVLGVDQYAYLENTPDNPNQHPLNSSSPLFWRYQPVWLSHEARPPFHQTVPEHPLLTCSPLGIYVHGSGYLPAYFKIYRYMMLSRECPDLR